MQRATRRLWRRASRGTNEVQLTEYKRLERMWRLYSASWASFVRPAGGGRATGLGSSVIDSV